MSQCPLLVTLPSPRPKDDDGDAPRSDLLKQSLLSPQTGDIIQFSAPIYFVEKIEGGLSLDIMRLGSLEGVLTVHYSTVDGSAKAGSTYEATSGTAAFEDGEDTKAIQISVINGGVWNATVEFKVTLSAPINGQLGKHLHTCRVKVIDNNMFPSDKFRKELEQGSVKAINRYALFWEYFKLNFQAADVGRDTLLIVCLDQLKSLYLLLTIYAQMYLVNVVLNTHDKNVEAELIMPTRIESAFCVGVAMVLPMGLIHLWEQWRKAMDIHGKSILWLQKSLFRKYMNYSEASRIDVDASKMQIAIDNNAEELANGYMIFLDILQLVVKLSIQVSFVLLKNRKAWWIVVSLPTIVAIWSVVREKQAFNIKGIAEPKAQMSGFLKDCCENYELIADYFQRPFVNEVFGNKAAKANSAKMPKQTFQLNTAMLLKWLTPVFISLYICKDAQAVIDGTVPLGTFLATIGVIKSISEDAVDGYYAYKGLSDAFKPLVRLTSYLNKQTDLRAWKRINRERRATSRIEIAKVRCQYDFDVCKYPTDMTPISISNVNFKGYDYQPVLEGICLKVMQGTAVAIFGHPQSGKSTLLRLVAHKQWPDGGQIFIPAHLRILNVSMDPMMLSISAYRNLILGIPDPSQVDKKRLVTILERLQMTKTLALIADDLESDSPQQENFDNHWQKRLPSTELALLHIARALIMNPEVMVLQRPFAKFSSATNQLILELLLENVRERGLCLPQAEREDRRPRTMFYIATERAQAIGADVVWTLKRTGENSHPCTVEIESLNKLGRSVLGDKCTHLLAL